MQSDHHSLILNQEVAEYAAAFQPDSTLESAFTEYVFQLLAEVAELGSPISGATARRDMEISGVDWDDERRVLTCLLSTFESDANVGQLTQIDLEHMLDRVLQFVLAATHELAAEMPSSDPSRDVALTIQEVINSAERVDLVVVTNREFRGTVPELAPIAGVRAAARVWDALAIHELMERGTATPRLDVDLTEFGVDGLEAIGPISVDADYESYLIVMTGDCLADVYAAYGPRLLELNVRSFLQARNKVNRGIQNTLAAEPEKFLAYNNGLSLTASSVQRRLIAGRLMVTSISDLQIVNGGQTTASLYWAKYRSKADLSAVRVQAKLTVLGESARIELAPKISLYANSQNPIRMADFSANDPFHVELQRLSREVVPPTDGDIGSKWFYERSRGQYADLISSAQTPARVATVRREYPVRQKFLKTDIAKYELLWDQRPNLVALGGERYFAQFMQFLRERPSQVLPDQIYYQHFIAKAILWRSTDAVVGRLALGGYKAQTVAYVMSIISKRTAQRVDLDRVWSEQTAPASWVDSVAQLAPIVHEMLISSAGNRNVSEWAKRPECWDALQELEWAPPADLISTRETRSDRSIVAPTQPGTSLPASEGEVASTIRTIEFGSDNWFELSAWAKDTNNLASWQRSIAFSLGKLIAQGRKPSAKQAVQGVKILDESARLGFGPSSPMFPASQ